MSTGVRPTSRSFTHTSAPLGVDEIEIVRFTQPNKKQAHKIEMNTRTVRSVYHSRVPPRILNQTHHP